MSEIERARRWRCCAVFSVGSEYFANVAKKQKIEYGGKASDKWSRISNNKFKQLKLKVS